MPPGVPRRYLIAKLHGDDVCAIAGPGEGVPTWRTYIAVDNANVTVDRLVSAGATVASAPADHGDDGRAAVLTDPEGIEFRIWQARRRLGAQVVNEPGAWNFSDFHAANPTAAMAFYEKAFGWQATRTALIRDPQDAAFTASQFTPPTG